MLGYGSPMRLMASLAVSTVLCGCSSGGAPEVSSGPHAGGAAAGGNGAGNHPGGTAAGGDGGFSGATMGAGAGTHSGGGGFQADGGSSVQGGNGGAGGVAANLGGFGTAGHGDSTNGGFGGSRVASGGSGAGTAGSAGGIGGVDGAGGSAPPTVCPTGQKRACVLTVGSPCTSGIETCDGSGWGACIARAPIDEWCNNVDDDCDGQVDEGLTSCAVASAEVCDGMDNDQDGAVDESASEWASPVTLVEAVNTNGDSALAVDWSGTAHLAYYDSVNKYLYYTHSAPGGQWSTPEYVDVSGSVGSAVSIAVALTGRVHVAYRDASNARMKYATRSGAGEWGIPVQIGADVNVGDYTAIAVDPSAVVHVAYHDITHTSLRYARRSENGTWTDEPVDNSANVGRAPAIAVEPNGTAHVSYYNVTNKSLRYAWRAPGDSGSWSTNDLVDNVDNAGSNSSIAVDDAGGLHITYYRAGLPSKDLRYAYKSPGGSWSVDPNPVDFSSSDYGSSSALRIDPAGQLHVLFRDEQAQQLVHSTRQGGTWQPATVVDTSTNVGKFVSFGINDSGIMVASYYDVTNSKLKATSRCLGRSVAPVERVSFELVPELSDIDVGWTGNVHDLPWVSGAVASMAVISCESPTAPRGQCELEGPVASTQNADLQRCTRDVRQTCDTDAHCERGSCATYFGAPTPVIANSASVCIVSRIVGQTAGTINFESGETSMATFDLISDVYWESIGQSCPICEGDAQPMNRNSFEGGHCVGGEYDGLPCDAGGYSDLVGWTSLDCPPDGLLLTGGAQSGVAGLPLSLGPLSTEGFAWAPSTDSPDCTTFGFTNMKCFCAGQGKPNDCGWHKSGAPLCKDDGDNEGVCAALHCANNPNSWCSGDQDCPGDTCIISPTQVATEPQCAMLQGLYCAYDDANCDEHRPGDTCSVDAPDQCFGETILADGTPSPLVAEAAQIRIGGVTCGEPAVSHTQVDSTAGFPGPVRVQATMNVRHFLP